MEENDMANIDTIREMLNILSYLKTIKKEVDESGGESATLIRYINLIEAQLKAANLDPSVIE